MICASYPKTLKTRLNLNNPKENYKNMSERVRNIYDMFVGTREFDAVNFND
ncbi:MAG: hypothetical protein LH614_17110 [Pyrinomonadaceae bacterium]|nr:hypothetical protein [Pyrinomonadaceae bacterium]